MGDEVGTDVCDLAMEILATESIYLRQLGHDLASNLSDNGVVRRVENLVELDGLDQ